MKVKIFLLCFLMLFLTACTYSPIIQEEREVEDYTEESIIKPSVTSDGTESVQSSSNIDSDNLYTSYSGEWICWNNPENEDDGGVSLTITVEDHYLTGTFSAWSSNYGRLASSDISGDIQDDLCITSFSDDGRGHSGTILLTFGQEQITADVSVQPQDLDFKFPAGPTVLHLKKVDSLYENTATDESSTPTHLSKYHHRYLYNIYKLNTLSFGLLLHFHSF